MMSRIVTTRHSLPALNCPSSTSLVKRLNPWLREIARNMRTWKLSGFSVDQSVVLKPHDFEDLSEENP